MSWLNLQHQDADFEPAEQAESVKLLRTSQHTARKAHPCIICEGLILPGQRYQLDALLDDGAFSLNRHHRDGAECQEAAALRAAWEREQAEIALLAMEEDLILDRAGGCHTCDGFGLDPDRRDWTRCPTCGGAGAWDQGESLRDAIATPATEPRIPAFLPPLTTSTRTPRNTSAKMPPTPQRDPRYGDELAF